MSRFMTKPTKWVCAQSDQSSLCAEWVAKDPSFLHADSEVSDQTGRMPRLIWVFAGRTLTLLVLSRGGSINVLQVRLLELNLTLPKKFHFFAIPWLQCHVCLFVLIKDWSRFFTISLDVNHGHQSPSFIAYILIKRFVSRFLNKI